MQIYQLCLWKSLRNPSFCRLEKYPRSITAFPSHYYEGLGWVGFFLLSFVLFFPKLFWFLSIKWGRKPLFHSYKDFVRLYSLYKGLLDLQINADHAKPCVLMLVNNYNLKCHKKKSIKPFPGDQQIALSKDYNSRLGSFSIDSCLISLSKKQPYITL